MKRFVLCTCDLICGTIGIALGTYWQVPFFSVAGTFLMCCGFSEMHYLGHHNDTGCIHFGCTHGYDSSTILQQKDLNEEEEK